MRAPRFALLAVPLLAVALVAALALTVSAHAAQTQAVQAKASGPADGRYYLQSATTGLNAAKSQDAVLQHRPKGDEDHQQWSVRADAAHYLLENTDDPGRCLGRAGALAALVACASADARWEVSAGRPSQFTIKDPAADRFLTVVASGDTYAERLQVGAAGDLAQWYLTPLTLPRTPVPGGDDLTLDQATFLTAHNAYANGVDGGFAPPLVNLFPNQSRGLSQQLADGVRGFMLDIYQTRDGAILCHQSCSLVSRPVALWVDLKRIVEFLNQHPTEIVTVFLEDYVAPDVLRAELARVPGLPDLLFRPDQDGVRDHGWPRLSELRQRGKRLLMFTDHSRAQDAAAGLTRDSFGVMYQREWTVENHWSIGPGSGASDWACYSRWYGGGLNVPLTRTEPGFRPLFVMNHFRDTPVPGTVGTDNTKVMDRTRRFCEPAARKKPTFLAVDRYDLGNPMSAVTELNTYWYAG
jgi:hypothetical protein